MKETKKQIKAQVINEVKKQYDQKLQLNDKHIERLAKEIQEYREKNNQLRLSNKTLQDENLELKDKLSSYEEWIERMQDFCNLPEEERSEAFKTYMNSIQSNIENTQAFKTLSAFTQRMSNLFLF